MAYRLLGSMSDADDAVPETWHRLTSADTSEVPNLGGWLTMAISPDRTITAIDVIADPERLRRLRLAVLPE